MSKITIIGLGNVGLRHLEGCLKIKKINKIYAIDKEEKRIEFCKLYIIIPCTLFRTSSTSDTVTLLTNSILIDIL